MQDPPDLLFLDNLNFFTKAYLVSLCTCLESFLQDVAFRYVSILEHRLALAKIPHNAVRWAVSREVKEKELSFIHFALSVSRKELADELSGNPGKTTTLFKHIGIDLQASEGFREHKDVVGAVVAIRCERGVLAGLLVGAAIGCKPWAAPMMPMRIGLLTRS